MKFVIHFSAVLYLISFVLFSLPRVVHVKTRSAVLAITVVMDYMHWRLNFSSVMLPPSLTTAGFDFISVIHGKGLKGFAEPPS